MSVIVALQFDRHVETARFQSVKHKAQITLFLYIGPHSSSDPPTGRASVWEQLQVQIRICYNSGTVHLRLPNVLVRQVKCAVWGLGKFGFATTPLCHFATLSICRMCRIVLYNNIIYYIIIIIILPSIPSIILSTFATTLMWQSGNVFS